jgi:murein DD-endopeptidase MepM/ murein hydrolase activator NlpD
MTFTSLKVFPIAGGAVYWDDYNQDPSRGRVHDGVDLLGAKGTPLLAVDDGNVRFGTDVKGGNVANLRTADGTRYYYAHLHAFEGSNRAVKASDVIGYLGHTGNAQGTPNHLHFEIHPGGGEDVNPYSLLRQAPITSKSAAGPKSVLWPLTFLALVGVGVWAYSRPQEASRLFRRLAR